MNKPNKLSSEDVLRWQAMSAALETAQAKLVASQMALENLRLSFSIKYQIDDDDRVDLATGLIHRGPATDPDKK